jgi:hypothetical protein
MMAGKKRRSSSPYISVGLKLTVLRWSESCEKQKGQVKNDEQSIKAEGQQLFTAVLCLQQEIIQESSPSPTIVFIMTLTLSLSLYSAEEMSA